MRSSLPVPLLSAGNLVIGMGAFAVIGLLMPLTESFAISPAEAGFVLTIYALGLVAGLCAALALGNFLLGGRLDRGRTRMDKPFPSR